MPSRRERERHSPPLGWAGRLQLAPKIPRTVNLLLFSLLLFFFFFNYFLCLFHSFLSAFLSILFYSTPHFFLGALAFLFFIFYFIYLFFFFRFVMEENMRNSFSCPSGGGRFSCFASDRL